MRRPESVLQPMTLTDALAKAFEFYGSGQWREAEQLCRAILATRTDQPDALKVLALIAAQTQRTAEAERLLAVAIGLRSDDPELLANHATTLKELRRFEDALRDYDLALRLQPDHLEALFNRGATLQALGRADDAVQSFSRALALRPGLAEAHYCRGNSHYELGRLELARRDYEQAASIRPDYVDAHNNLGVTLLTLGRFEEAERSLDRALRLDPKHAGAHYNRGLALQKLRRPEEALQHCERAIELRPDHAAFLARGHLLMQLGQAAAAVESYDRAIALRPRNAEAHIGRGDALQQLGQLEEALASYERAVQVEPENGEAHYRRGDALRQAFRLGEALQSYATAYRLRPEQSWLLGVWVHERMQMCAWDGLERDVAEIVSRTEQGLRATPPFSLLGLVDSALLQRRAAEIWIEAEREKESRPLPPPARRPRRNRIRVGYFSADLHEHATAFLAAQLFERHDHERFELIAFSFGPDKNDDMRARLQAAFHTFLDVRTRADAEIALLAREQEIDIAVDMKGYTYRRRAGIFAHRAAPIQLSYLGYPGTSAAPHMDYLIADRTLIPAESRAGYSERIVYLPDSYQPNDRQRKIADTEFFRQDFGLPDGAFVFCSFNAAYKLTPRMFDIWARILKAVPGSVLWLLAVQETVAANLRREAAARGLDAGRLVFAPPMLPAAHLARLRVADLFLDTLPYNAHTTASDALWAGLPVLTCAGDSFAARVGASLVRAVGMPELITSSLEDYEALAIELARNPGRLAALREQLRQNRSTAALFDSDAYTRHLEAAYTEMYERYHERLPPDDIHI